MSATEQPTAPAPRPARVGRPRLVVGALAAGCVLAAVGFGADAVDDVRGQRAADAGQLETRTTYLYRTDSYHDSSATEFRLTEHGTLVPGQIEVTDVPRSSRLHGTGEVTASYWDGDVVALRFEDGAVITSALFGTRGAVASFLLAGGLLVAAAALVLGGRGRLGAGRGRAVAAVLVATFLAWGAVASGLPIVASVVVLEAVGLAAAALLRRAAAAPS